MKPHSFPRIRSAGFTLMEMVITITIMGVIAGMVAVFIRAPVATYFDSTRRAELTDVADTAVRRLARDLHLALPNSVRHPVNGSDQCVEFMPTKIGGRYRAVPDSAGNGNPLDFTAVDGGFDMLWPNSALPPASRLKKGDIVVVFNDGSATGNAYTGSNAIRIGADPMEDASAKTTAVSFVDASVGAPFNRKQLPNESPFYRFQVVPADEHVVVYACTGGQLIRYRNTIGAGGRPRPADCGAMRTGTPSVLADNISACSLHYEPPGAAGVNSRNGILAVSLQITQEGESVRIYQQVHVDNTP